MVSKELSDKNFWMVRAGTENELIESFYENGIVAISWTEVGDLSNHISIESMESIVEETYENKNTKQVGGCAGQLFRFAHKIKKGDIVLSYDQSCRTYLVGEVSGPYLWNPSTAPEAYPHVRRVNWKEMIHRDKFDRFAKNTLGSSLTVFSLDRVREDIKAVLSESKGDDSTIRSKI